MTILLESICSLCSLYIQEYNEGNFKMNVVKTALMGYPGVGKSTILKLLSGRSEQDLKKAYDPTIGVDFLAMDLWNGLKACLWDLGGQSQFRSLWDSFLPGTGLICLVTDSTPENVQKCKDIVRKYKNYNGARLIALANKQDLPNSMKPEEIEKELGIKTIGMVATNMQTRRTLFNILQKAFTSYY
ncbi:MAG: GTP-binding protein [Candidatus Lokiarchaeota archaeon]|nr:GTP-binding protein [Candidatus Lokiarchaeota archaeon]